MDIGQPSQVSRLGSQSLENNAFNVMDEHLQAKSILKDFVSNFETLDGERRYVEALKKIANLETVVLKIEIADLLDFAQKQHQFLEMIKTKTKKFMKALYEVCDELLPEPGSLSALREIENDTRVSEQVRLAEQLLRERQVRAAEQQRSENPESEADTPNVVPRSLIRRYSIQLSPEKQSKGLSLRNVGAQQYGGLVDVKGIVTRVTTVKLQLLVAAYICEICGHEIYEEVLGNEKQFNPIVFCPTTTCRRIGRRKLPLVMNNRRSKFRKYQDILLQELPEQVPVGHVPQHIRVEATDETTMTCKGGDIITTTGIFLGEKIRTFEGRMGGERLPYIKALNIFRHTKTFKEIGGEIPLMMENQIDSLSMDPNIYFKLANSLAPEIFGMIDVKKALLLQLVAGNMKNLADGIKLRGDLNICMCGDPGVAKSQLLKAVSRASPRCVYTTGKGSSAVGLTASVSRDKYSGETILEPGALVLADMGICCIDEFDKMSDTDRTAIHEVMEQQTVSIAKAGVTTSLNARTAVLAASNPVLGRYNRKLSPAENMGLPAALLSRFDLIFILLDTPDETKDLELAEHVTKAHIGGARVEPVPKKPDSIPINLLRAYLSQAKLIEPEIPDSLVSVIVEEYVNMRQEDKRYADRAKQREQLTPRQLMSLLRLSHALAKIRMNSHVSREDIQEAMRLFRASKNGLQLAEKGSGRMTEEKLYTLVQRFIENRIKAVEEKQRESMQIEGDEEDDPWKTINWSEVEKFCIKQGAGLQLIKRMVTTYESLQVWKYDEETNMLFIPR